MPQAPRVVFDGQSMNAMPTIRATLTGRMIRYQAVKSGVFVRFQDPQLAVPRRSDPTVSDFYVNKAWVAVDTGFEVQIDETAAGTPPGLDMHRTGAIYSVPVGTAADQQDYQRGPVLQPGDWHDYEIHVAGQT